MPPRKSNTLTEAELRLMKILWRRGESAVTDMVDALPESEQLAYNSVLTTIRILEQKGYVEHRQEVRAFVYWPCVQENEASSSEVRNVLNRFFGNLREKLVLSLLDDDGISAEELGRRDFSRICASLCAGGIGGFVAGRGGCGCPGSLPEVRSRRLRGAPVCIV